MKQPHQYTKAMFERNKTERIAALCEGLKAVSHLDKPGNYGERSPLNELLYQLVAACNSAYEESEASQ